MVDKITSNANESNRRRDSVSLRIIGIFFACFSLLVMLGTLWEDRPKAMIVNMVAGGVLLLIGCGMAAYGYRIRPSGTDRH
jgi:uncharacterized membrane protein